MSKIKLLDRADGVKGHYCLGKTIPPYHFYWHFWNDRANDWCSAGTVYVGKDTARAKREEVNDNMAAKSTSKAAPKLPKGRIGKSVKKK